MCTGGECKEEFSCKKLGLEYDRPTDFGLSQFGKKSLVYVIYKWLVGLFFLVSFFYGFGSYPKDPWWKWLIFLTHWGFAVLTLAVLLGAVVALHVYLMLDGDELEKNNYKMLLGYKVYWVFNNINLCVSPTISAIYWLTVFDADVHELNYPSLTFHVVNIFWTLIDFFFCAVPVRILHAFHAFCFGAVYLTFVVIYWQAEGTDERGNPYIYSVVNFEEDSTKAITWSLILFGMLIVFQVIWFALYKLRLYIYRCCGCVSLQSTASVNHPF